MDLAGFTRTQPDKPAHIVGSTGEVVTYADLNRRSLRFAHLMRELGLHEGDVIAFQLENGPRIFEVVWGALRSGLYLAQIEAGFPSELVSHILRDSGARLFVTDAAHSSTAGVVRKDVPTVHTWLMAEGVIPGFQSFEEAIATQSERPLAREPEGKVMNYSGGSTGMPKAVKGSLPGRLLGDPAPELLNRARLWGYSPATIQTCGAPTTRLLMAYSVMTQRFGGTVIINDSPDPLDVLRFIERYRVTHLQTLPMWFLKLHKAPAGIVDSFDLSSLEYICHAGAPCPPRLKAAMMERFGPIIHEYYSGSEGAGMTYIGPDEWLRKPGSVGTAIVGKIRIVGSDGEEVPVGTPGEIYFEGGPYFEYHNLPERTASAFNKHGWATLGDIGQVDEEGHLYLLDRSGSEIVQRDRTLYCQPIENEVVMMPEVGDVAVLPGQAGRLAVLVEPAGQQRADLEQRVRAEVSNVASVPPDAIQVHIVPSLGRPLTGKLNKSALAKTYAHLLRSEGANAPRPGALTS